MERVLELYGRWWRRDLSQRYAGAGLGAVWLLLQPLSFIVVITLVFNGFFKTKWPGGDGSAIDYAMNVFVGLAIHNFLADVLSRSPACVVSHGFLVTKVRFPLALLPLVVVGVAGVQLALSLSLVLVVSLAWSVLPVISAMSSWWALPVALVPSLLTMVGVAWLLAALGTYLRDLGNLMPAVAAFLMFLMPVFYPPEFVPSEMAWLISGNPMAWSIESLRDLLFKGELPSLSGSIAYTAAGLVAALAGWWVFQRVSPGFADVL
jgi:lipopolysaccharide transport system permease protein